MSGARKTAPAKRTAVQPRRHASDVYLVVDTRERAVIPFIETVFQDFEYVTAQINTGDFLICRRGIAGGEPTILACVERKTHEDFAASFKDGRYENVRKMHDLRDRSGCQLFFLSEGAAFPSPNRRYQRIPYASILAALTKLMIRDGVFVVQTEDESHSAKRLYDLVRVFDAEVPYPVIRVAPADIATTTTAGAATTTDIAATTTDVPKSLTARIEKTDDEAATAMWAQLRGISVVLGKLLTRQFSAAELAAGSVSTERIRALKTFTGRPITADAVKSLMSVAAGSEEHAVKLISGLSGITPAVAAIVVKGAGSFDRVCKSSIAELSMISVPQKTRPGKFGDARATRLRRMLWYKAGDDGRPPAERPGHVLGRPDELPEAEEPPEVELDEGALAYLEEILNGGSSC